MEMGVCGYVMVVGRPCRREALTGRLSPVREWRFLPFCLRDLALGGTADFTAVSGGGVGAGAVVANEGGCGGLVCGIPARLARGGGLWRVPGPVGPINTITNWPGVAVSSAS